MTEYAHLKEGVRLTMHQSALFKTISIHLAFHCELNEDHACHRLLPLVLRRGCQGLNTTQKIARHLDDQYGASFHAGTLKKGERQLLLFSLELLHERYVKEQESYLAQGFHFLNRLINKPLLKEASFVEEFIEQEKQGLIRNAKELRGCPEIYSQQRCIQEMCSDERYGRFGFENPDELQAIKGDKLFKVYKEIVEYSPLDMIVIGDIDPKRIKSMVLNSLKLVSDKPNVFLHAPLKRISSEVKRVYEVERNTEPQLVFGFRTNSHYPEKSFYATFILSEIIKRQMTTLYRRLKGVEPSDQMFGVFIDKFYGVLTLQCAMRSMDVEEVFEKVNNLLDEIRHGIMNEEEYQCTVNQVVTDIQMIQDDPVRLMEFYLDNAVAGVECSLEDITGVFRDMTIEQVIQAAKNMRLDTIYQINDRTERWKN